MANGNSSVVGNGSGVGNGNATVTLLSAKDKKKREDARRGGVSAHAKGVAHEWTQEEAKKAGHKGGRTVLERYGPEHYSEIGRKGGIARAEAKRAANDTTAKPHP
jgi:general stress protein YciG